MKWSGLLCSLMAPAVSAVPALVWQTNRDSTVAVHTSEDIAAETLFSESSDMQVFFVLGRQQDGSETLSLWTGAGSLPAVAEASSKASAIHHSVSNVQSPASLTQIAKAVDKNAMQVNLEELQRRFDESSADVQVSADGEVLPRKTHKANNRARALQAATTFIVDVPATTDPAVLDKIIVNSMEKADVVLTAVRSVQEVKMERSKLAHERISRMTDNTALLNSRRRLEDANANGQQGNNNAQQDMTNIYYVSMTPNIMAGLLFFFLFVFVTYIGLTCMGMIAGQDVYVKKMPAIGREA